VALLAIHTDVAGQAARLTLTEKFTGIKKLVVG